MPEDDAYWDADEAIGVVRIGDRDYMLRLQARISSERYSRAEGDELIALGARQGIRTHIHAKPYLLYPDYRATIALGDRPDPTGVVTDGEWTGMRRQPIGTAQARYYPKDRVLILWECFLDQGHTTADRTDDPNLRTLWTGVERFLLHCCPGAARLVTPGSDPMYATEPYRRFLGELGYARLGTAAFGKPLAPGDGGGTAREG